MCTEGGGSVKLPLGRITGERIKTCKGENSRNTRGLPRFGSPGGIISYVMVVWLLLLEFELQELVLLYGRGFPFYSQKGGIHKAFRDLSHDVNPRVGTEMPSWRHVWPKVASPPSCRTRNRDTMRACRSPCSTGKCTISCMPSPGDMSSISPRYGLGALCGSGEM